MKKATASIEILHYLNLLEQSSRNKALAYIKALFKSTPSKKNKDILSFAGVFGKDDLDEMEKAITEGCEKPDLNEW